VSTPADVNESDSVGFRAVGPLKPLHVAELADLNAEADAGGRHVVSSVADAVLNRLYEMKM